MKGRKIVFTAPNQVETQTTEFDLKIDDPKQVILKNHYSVISAGTELACLAGTEGWFPLPNTPGYIAVAEVVEAGDAVDVKPGQFCFTYGPHAEYFKIDTTDRFGGLCLPVPEKLSPELAPFTRMASIPMTAIRTATIELGDVVVVMGQGLVGNLAAQLAALQGATVYAVDIDDKRLELAKACGIEKTINSSEKDWQENFIDAAGGAHTLIDATGNSAVIESALNVIRPYGECILLGSPRAAHETNVTDTFNKIHLPPFATMKGALEWRFPTFENEFVKHSLARNSKIIMDLIADGRLHIKPLLTQQLTPEEAPTAYEALRQKNNDYVGVEFIWK